MRPKAYSYIRFSTPEQARGDSKRRQLAAAREYAIKENLDLVEEAGHIFLDEGVSAYKGKNRSDASNLKLFLDYVASGKIEKGSYLLIESLDRISREDVAAALPRFLDLLNADIVVVTLSDSMVYRKNPDLGSLVYSIVQMGRANAESVQKGDRIAKVWRNKQVLAREEKRPLGRACPYWLEYKEGRYCVIEDRANVVRRVFELTTQGYGQIQIMKLFNWEEVPVFGSASRNKSRLWGKSSIAKILSNRSVIGEYQPTGLIDGIRVTLGEPVKDYYPAIVDENVFYAASAARQQRAVTQSTKQAANFNVWSKVAICTKCRSPMHLVNKGPSPKGGRYLRCSAGVKGKCDNRSVRLDYAEEMFKEILAKLNSSSLVEDTRKQKDQKLAETKGRIVAAEKKLAELVSLVEEAPSVMLATLIQKKESELDDLKSLLEEEKISSSMQEVIDKGEFFDRLDVMSYEGRYAANLYLQRLDIKVAIKNDSKEIMFVAIRKEMPQFGILKVMANAPIYIPLGIESLKAVINQEDVTSLAVPYSKERLFEVLNKVSPEAALKVEAQGVDRLAKIPLDAEIKEKLLESFGLGSQKERT
ncbi:recombinase family protein [Pseudomonas sp. 9Ag]|uniref:recombinase family protein n=1 Tax=Pseudomonas sp. 9Ag TaxID=2653167 RepID=UPI0012EF8507|nr:recombinase family protein [Pseudomonas sp. 9Ag]VXC99213.1 Recombinase family protein [Pseudomonas sp. 9Ag]